MKNYRKQSLVQPKNNLRQQIEILQLIHKLLTHGFDLEHCLQLVSHRYQLANFHKQLIAGESFDKILANNDFDLDAVLTLTIGIESDSLQNSLKQSILILESKQQKREEIIEILKYPCLLLVLATLSITFVVYFLIPQFERILMSVDGYNEMVRQLFAIIRFGPYGLLIFLLTALVLGICFNKLKQEKQLALIFRFKFSKQIYQTIYNQLFCMNLASLLNTNLHLSEILTILSEQKANKLLASECLAIKTGLSCGKSISSSLTHKYYRSELLELIEDAEQDGLLKEYLQSYTKVISQERKKRSKQLILLIQPAFYIVFGGLILLMYAIIFIPMFAIMDNL